MEQEILYFSADKMLFRNMFRIFGHVNYFERKRFKVVADIVRLFNFGEPRNSLAMEFFARTTKYNIHLEFGYMKNRMDHLLYEYSARFNRFLVDNCHFRPHEILGKSIVWNCDVEKIILTIELLRRENQFSVDHSRCIMSKIGMMSDGEVENLKVGMKKINFRFEGGEIFQVAISRRCKKFLGFCDRENILQWMNCVYRSERIGNFYVEEKINSLAPKNDPAIALVENFSGDVCREMFEKFPDIIHMSTIVLHRIFAAPKISPEDYKWIKRCALKFMTFKRFMRTVGEHRILATDEKL